MTNPYSPMTEKETIPTELWAPPAIHPFTKVAVVIILSTTAFMAPSLMALYICLALATGTGLAGGGGKMVFTSSLAALFLGGLEYFISENISTPLVDYFAGFLLTMLRMSPSIILGVWIVSTLRVSDFLAAADRFHFPKSFSIVLGVSLRFLPAIAEETFQINMSLRTRGLKPGIFGFLRKPIRSMHLHLVPLLFRSLVIADELSAAAVTRGIEHPGIRSHVRASVFALNDFFLLFGFIVFSFFINGIPLYA